MGDRPAAFFGRKGELNWVTRQVEAAWMDPPYPPVILLYGSPGTGKTALIDAWIDAADANTEVELAWLRVTESPRAESLPDFVDRLARSAGARDATLRAGAKAVAVGILSDAAASRSGSVGASRAYTPKGAIREAHAAADDRTGSGNVGYAESLRRRLHVWLRGAGKRMGSKPLLVVILDRFDRFPPPVRSWLGRDLLPALCGARETWRCAFLLTGSRSWREGKQGEYWNVPADARTERELGPLLVEDCREWVAAHGASDEWTDALYEESEGVPARFAALLATDPPGSHRTDEKYPSVLAPLAARERRWVQAACFQEEFTVESLGILLGGEEGACAFAWLRTHLKVVLESGGGEGFRVRERHREEVRAWMRSKMTYRWQYFQRQAGNYDQLRRIVPDPEDRTTLARFAPVRFFSPGLLEKLFAGND